MYNYLIYVCTTNPDSGTFLVILVLVCDIVTT